MDLFTKYLFKKHRTAGVNERRGPIMLVYHGTPTNNKTPHSKYGLSAHKFLEQISFVHDQGWNTACVRDMAKIESLSPKTVFITFDDGYKNNFEGAFLPLVKLGLSATWFITTNCIGKYAGWMGPKTPDTKMLDRSELKEMAAEGMEIGSHTCSHPDLAVLGYPGQLIEIEKSKEELQSFLRSKVTSFAYPYGRYDKNSLTAVEYSGYKHGCTVRPGWTGSETNPFLIRRVTIFADDTLNTFARKLVFADNDVSFTHIQKYYLSRILARFR